LQLANVQSSYPLAIELSPHRVAVAMAPAHIE
jgi:hypothetical protein